MNNGKQPRNQVASRYPFSESIVTVSQLPLRPVLLLLFWHQAEDFIHILLHGSVVDHVLPECLVLCILLLLLSQQSGILFG